MAMTFYKQGAEAKLYITNFLGKKCLVKERFQKLYRHVELEKSLTSQRLRNEVRAFIKCRQCGISTPALHYIDQSAFTIYMEYLEQSITLKDYINKLLFNCNHLALRLVAELIGKVVAKLHDNDIIHGDLTTSNFLVCNDDVTQLILIDFGLTSLECNSVEDKGVDLYVLERAFLSTHPNTEYLFSLILESYESSSIQASNETIAKLNEVRQRGRKRTMVG